MLLIITNYSIKMSNALSITLSTTNFTYAALVNYNNPSITDNKADMSFGRLPDLNGDGINEFTVALGRESSKGAVYIVDDGSRSPDPGGTEIDVSSGSE